MKKSRSRGKRHCNPSISVLTKILNFLKISKQANKTNISKNTEVHIYYIESALHWLIFHKLVKRVITRRETVYVSLEK